MTGTFFFTLLMIVLSTTVHRYVLVCVICISSHYWVNLKNVEYDELKLATHSWCR